jgi:hypothetical protein
MYLSPRGGAALLLNHREAGENYPASLGAEGGGGGGGLAGSVPALLRATQGGGGDLAALRLLASGEVRYWDCAPWGGAAGGGGGGGGGRSVSVSVAGLPLDRDSVAFFAYCNRVHDMYVRRRSSSSGRGNGTADTDTEAAGCVSCVALCAGVLRPALLSAGVGVGEGEGVGVGVGEGVGLQEGLRRRLAGMALPPNTTAHTTAHTTTHTSTSGGGRGEDADAANSRRLSACLAGGLLSVREAARWQYDLNLRRAGAALSPDALLPFPPHALLVPEAGAGVDSSSGSDSSSDRSSGSGPAPPQPGAGGLSALHWGHAAHMLETHASRDAPTLFFLPPPPPPPPPSAGGGDHRQGEGQGQGYSRAAAASFLRARLDPGGAGTGPPLFADSAFVALAGGGRDSGGSGDSDSDGDGDGGSSGSGYMAFDASACVAYWKRGGASPADTDSGGGIPENCPTIRVVAGAGAESDGTGAADGADGADGDGDGDGDGGSPGLEGAAAGPAGSSLWLQAAEVAVLDLSAFGGQGQGAAYGAALRLLPHMPALRVLLLLSLSADPDSSCLVAPTEIALEQAGEEGTEAGAGAGEGGGAVFHLAEQVCSLQSDAGVQLYTRAVARTYDNWYADPATAGTGAGTAATGTGTAGTATGTGTGTADADGSAMRATLRRHPGDLVSRRLFR